MSALGHLTVLDLSRVRAGPSCARLFADLGARVIRVEAPPGVDPNEGMTGPRDGPDMQNLHRNKLSVTLNLKKPRARELLLRLVAGADVLIENYRPGVMDRLGLGWPVLEAANPRLVMVSISGFGPDGPAAGRAGFDQIAQGMGGLMALTGLPGQGPVRAGAAVADVAAGLYATVGALAALAERERSGRGQWVHSSLLGAQIAMMDFQAARYLVAGEVPEPAGNEHPVSVPTGVIATADGHINLGVAGDGQWRALCVEIGRPDWAEDPELATNPGRRARRAEVWEMLGAVFATRPSAEWLERLERAGVPAGPIYAMDEVFADPQVRHLGMAAPVDHPRLGRIHVVAQPVRLSRTPPLPCRPAPDAGADTEEVLAGLGLSAAELSALRAEGVT